MNSHVSQLRLSPHQHISYPLDFKQLALDVIHSNGGVRHGHNAVFIWERELMRNKKGSKSASQ